MLPPDDNVIVSVHCYEPFHFTHQGAGWTAADVQQTGIQFPGPPAQPLVPDPKLDLKPWVLDWIQEYNTLPTAQKSEQRAGVRGQIEIPPRMVGLLRTPGSPRRIRLPTSRPTRQSRANFYAAFRRAAEQQKLGWAIWDWSANFRYWDKKTGKPMPGMHEALFGKSN